LYGFREGRVAGCRERGGGGYGSEDVRWEEVEGEGEVWSGEDGERFDEDVGNGFVPGEVRVKLVSEFTFWSVIF
jgi:hypothetical protein